MTEITLELDQKAAQSINDLMDHYKVNSRAEIISKAIAMLKIAAHVGKTGGSLYARKGTNETKLIVR
jgi:metal-responsive CopG/Arc/MetJ family transcriptional regulator